MKVNGYRVRWYYEKQEIPVSRNKKEIILQREKTICRISKEDDQSIDMSTFVSHHTGDKYNRNTARMNSLRKTMKLFQFSKEERSSFWEAYRSMTPTPRW